MIQLILKKLRKERGWTQKELEDLTGIAQRNISSYEAGKLMPSGRTASRFAAAFEVRVEDLAGENSKEPALALNDTELLTPFREVEEFPEADNARLKRMISLVPRQNRTQEMIAS